MDAAQRAGASPPSPFLGTASVRTRTARCRLLDMTVKSSWYASELRRELGVRNRRWARGRAHVESYGNPPVIVYLLENGRHGNFFDPAYAAIAARPEWMRRFDKIHAQGWALPKPEPESGPARKWRELDSSMSSDALLMNVFCTPGVTESPAVRRALGVEGDEPPVFGWKARVPLKGGHFDRTEIDMRWGDLLVEAKLTESDFQIRAAAVVEAYRDFDAVFDRELLPRVELPTTRQREATEFPEDYSQELEEVGPDAGESARAERFVVPVSARTSANAGIASSAADGESAYVGYQLIRNVLAAHAHEYSFCVIHDERRPDLREAWFDVMAAVKSAEMRVRLKVLTWQELAALLPEELQEFLDRKYGIVASGRVASPAGDAVEFD